MRILPFGTLGKSKPNPYKRSTELRLGMAAYPPRGWTAFRARVTSAVSGVGVVPTVIHLTDTDLTTLGRVSNKVNEDTQYVRDAMGVDVWEIAKTKGDCEDIAIKKREELVRYGYERGAFRLAHCTTKSGEGHAVLLVTTDRGDFILDNVYPGCRRWFDVPYQINAVEVPGKFWWRHVLPYEVTSR